MTRSNRRPSRKQPSSWAAFGQFLYDQSPGDLWWYRDGAGRDTVTLIASLGGGTLLLAGDLFVV